MKPSLTIILPLGLALLLIVVLMIGGKVPLGYNVRNLVVRWKTTLLTAVAFTLVICLLTVMLAFVNGMNRLTENSGQPGNVIVLSDGASDELFSNLAHSETGDVERQPGVARDEEGNLLCSREVYIVVNQPIATEPGKPARRRFVQVRGVEIPALAGKVHGLKLFKPGEWFSSAGVRAAANDEAKPGSGNSGAPEPVGPKSDESYVEAVLGQGIARQLGKDQKKAQLQIGDVFDLGPRKWIVVGIMNSAGSTFDSEIWAKRDLIGQHFGKSNYTSIVLRTDGPKEAKELAELLTTNFKKSALQAQTETDYFANLSQTNKQFLVAIIIVAVLMSVGGIFGVMNTMFAAISQRTKDIGVLRLMGFGSRQILVSFLIESLMIAMAGGLLGCAFGFLANGWSATSIVGSGQGGGKTVVLTLVVDINTIGVGLLLAFLMGALGGLLPSLAAMRMRPLEALR